MEAKKAYTNYIESYFIANPPETTGSLLHDPLFQIKLVENGVYYYSFTTLHSLLFLCKKHDLPEYHYIERLRGFVGNGGLVDFRLLYAMEEEGYDIERLLSVFCEYKDWRGFNMGETMYEMAEAQLKEALMGTQEPGSPGDFLQTFQNFIHGVPIEKECAAVIAQAMQAEVWRTFPEFQAFPQQVEAQFIKETSDMAFGVAFEAAGFDDHLESGDELDEFQEADRLDYTPQAKREKILKRRMQYDIKPAEKTPVRATILEYEMNWRTGGDNSVTIWYRGDCDLGTFYYFVPFSYLIDEAYLHFPELFQKIKTLQKELDAIPPKEQQIVETLLIERTDLTPLLASYLSEWVDIPKHVKEHEKFVDHALYDSVYDVFVKNHHYSEEELAEAEKSHDMDYLEIRLTDIARNILHDFFPEFKAHAKAWMRESVDDSIRYSILSETMNNIWGLKGKLNKGELG